MFNFVKKFYSNLLLVLIYTAIAMTVYIVWFDSMWHLWYIDMITGIVILAIGGVLGYFYIKSEMNKDEKKPEVKEEKKETKEINDGGDGLSGE